jgi:hypothetical protein
LVPHATIGEHQHVTTAGASGERPPAEYPETSPAPVPPRAAKFEHHVGTRLARVDLISRRQKGVRGSGMKDGPDGCFW